MWHQLRELILGMKAGLREFRRASSEIRDEIDQAIDLQPPPDETDSRVVRNVIIFFALLCYTVFWLSLFRAL